MACTFYFDAELAIILNVIFGMGLRDIGLFCKITFLFFTFTAFCNIPVHSFTDKERVSHITLLSQNHSFALSEVSASVTPADARTTLSLSFTLVKNTTLGSSFHISVTSVSPG